MRGVEEFFTGGAGRGGYVLEEGCDLLRSAGGEAMAVDEAFEFAILMRNKVVLVRPERLLQLRVHGYPTALSLRPRL